LSVVHPLIYQQARDFPHLTMRSLTRSVIEGLAARAGRRR